MRRKEILQNIIGAGKEEQEQKHGRSGPLLELRNQCLLARYFYYGFYKKKCYEEILQLLVTEFYITTERIVKIIQKHTDEVMEMREKRLSRYRMQVLWPHYKW